MERNKIIRVLTIAGSDSSAGAGVQLDIRIFDRLGVHGMTVVTALTAQNTLGVQKINKVAPRVITAQIDSVMRDIGADACKTGMLLDSRTVSATAERIHRREIKNLVIDPVILAKDGTALLSAKGVERMKRHLIPGALAVTPNVLEAEKLSGIGIKTLADMKKAAEIIQRLGCKWVIAKGGHLECEPVDILFNGEDFIELPGSRIEGPAVHGTGCAFSAALTARIALGDSVPDAARFSKSFVSDLIKNAVKLGKGALLIR